MAKKAVKAQSTTKDYKLLMILGSIAVAGFVAYAPSLKNGFVTWDDDVYVLNNSLIRSFSMENLVSIFTEFLWGNYHPLTVISLLIDYQIWALNPWGYHLVNLLFHLANSILLAYIVFLFPEPGGTGNKESKRYIPALIAGALFALHPLHVESVTWISERKDVLYTFFTLLAFLTWIKGLEHSDPKSQWITLGLFICASLAKGMALIFPLILVGMDWYIKGHIIKEDIIRKWPFWLVSLTLGIVAILAQQSVGAIREDAGYNILDNLFVALYSLCWYLWKMLVPFNLSAFYPYPKKAAGEALPFLFYLSPLILSGITWLAWKIRHKHGEFLFGWIWYLASMIMVVKLVPLSEAMTADRYFYLSSAGLFMGIAIFFGRNFSISKFYYLPIVVSLGWAGLTYSQTQIWKDDLTLFGDMIQKYPELSLAYNNRGKYLYQAGKKEEAIKDFIKSAELDPDNESAQNNVGFILMESNRIPEALTYFKKAVEIHPEFADGFFNLGNAYARQNKYPEAIGAYQRSIEIFAANPGVWNNLGNVFKESGKSDSAKYAYQKSLELDGNGKNALTGIGEVEEKNGNLEEAKKWYQKASERNPNDADLANRVGITYAKEAKYQEAIQWFNRAAKAKPEEVATWQNLAMAYERTGQIPEAIKAYQEAAKLGSPSAQEVLTRNKVSW